MEESMRVKLISYSQTNPGAFSDDEITDYPRSAQDLVAFCARVSNPSNQFNTKTSEKLLAYLIEHKHWSPFEMVSACLEITTTRDIARQMLRHRSFAFQEFSQRYADPFKELDFVLREARYQDANNRQNSIELPPTLEGANLQEKWEWAQKRVIHEAKAAYDWAIKNGIAKEVARSVLPEGNTISKMYMNGTLRSWIHYVELRSSNGTQKEHMQIAVACAEIISKVFPIIKTL